MRIATAAANAVANRRRWWSWKNVFGGASCYKKMATIMRQTVVGNLIINVGIFLGK
jgi:hypothetical protein